MPDPSPPPATGLTIPADTQAKFPALIELIKGSESMNNEERQYWINILPIMTPEQLKNLEDILVSEKQQLAAIDAKYSKQSPPQGSGASPAETGAKIAGKKREREAVEQADHVQEQEAENNILSQIQAL